MPVIERLHTLRKSMHRDAEAGFTLLELLVVLGILALLATVGYPQVLRYLGVARTETAKARSAPSPHRSNSTRSTMAASRRSRLG